MSSDQRILLWDIETAPLLAYVWQAKTEYIGAHQFCHDSFMLSWAAKWHGQKKVHGQVLTADEARQQDDGRIVQGLADMIRQADVIVAHNGDRFDVPMLNNRLLLLGLEPLQPVKTVDTLKLAKRTLRLASNKLDYLAQALGVGQKIKTDFDLWRDCYQGKVRALREMYRYNRMDVDVLESVFDALRPYAKGLPRLVDAEHEGEEACPYCGSGDLQRRGVDRTNAGTRQRYQCQGCSRWSRGRSGLVEPRLATVPLQ